MKTTEKKINGVTHITIDPGETVLCDSCNQEFTHSKDTGGMLFRSYAIGPCCEQDWKDGAEEHDESHFIKAACPEGMAFADWVRDQLR